MKKLMPLSLIIAGCIGLAGCQSVPTGQEYAQDVQIIQGTGACNFFAPAFNDALNHYLPKNQERKNEVIGSRLIGLNYLIYDYAMQSGNQNFAIKPLSVEPDVLVDRVLTYCTNVKEQYQQLPKNVKYTKPSADLYVNAFLYPFSHYLNVQHTLQSKEFPHSTSIDFNHFMQQEAYNYAIHLNEVDRSK